jgi:cysteine desulfurase
MQIYLDYSATTPPRPEVVSHLAKVLRDQCGNPSSLHSWGEGAALILEKARFQVARLINAPNPDSIIFTSGGTESNNLVLWGIARNYSTPQHLIISSVEHSAISQPAQRLIKEKGWEVTYLAVNSQGRVESEDLLKAIRKNTVLISIIYGQSEVGTIQPIAQLAKIALDHQILFHTDAVQLAGRLPLDVQLNPVDLLSLSSHKIYGPQGVGAIYLKEGVSLSPFLEGGGQERGLRSGTQPVALIAAFGLAAELALNDLPEERTRLEFLRNHLFKLLADCPYLTPTGDLTERLPHHLSFLVNGSHSRPLLNSRTIVRQMNQAGIGISAGSACHSGKVIPSPILLAMGYSEEQALCGIRLTLGHATILEDIEWTALVLTQILERILLN